MPDPSGITLDRVTELERQLASAKSEVNDLSAKFMSVSNALAATQTALKTLDDKLADKVKWVDDRVKSFDEKLADKLKAVDDRLVSEKKVNDLSIKGVEDRVSSAVGINRLTIYGSVAVAVIAGIFGSVEIWKIPKRVEDTVTAEIKNSVKPAIEERVAKLAPDTQTSLNALLASANETVAQIGTIHQSCQTINNDLRKLLGDRQNVVLKTLRVERLEVADDNRIGMRFDLYPVGGAPPTFKLYDNKNTEKVRIRAEVDRRGGTIVLLPGAPGWIDDNFRCFINGFEGLDLKSQGFPTQMEKANSQVPPKPSA